MPTHSSASVSVGSGGSVSNMPPETLPQSPLNVIINGQSNAVAQPHGTAGFTALVQHLGPDIRGWSESSGSMVALVDEGGGVRTAGDTNGGGQIGTLLARRIADRSGGTVNLFALGYTSQGIDYFLPDYTASNALYLDGSEHDTKNNFELLKERVTASSLPIELVVYVGNEANKAMSEADYLEKARALVDAYRTFAPLAHFIWVPPIDSADAAGFDHIHDAIDTLVSERYYVHSVDNRDMEGNTAWYGGANAFGEHYATYIGYEEAGERLDAKLLGTTRANVAAVDDIEESGFTFDHRFQYVHSVSSGNVAVWQSTLGAKSLSGSTSPLHVANDSLYANRSTVDTIGVDCDYTATGMPAGDEYTFFIVGNLDSLDDFQRICDLSGGGRVGAALHYRFSDPDVLIDGAALPFQDGGAVAVDTDVHTWVFTVDGPNEEAKWYLDGTLEETKDIGVVDGTTNPTMYYGSLLDVSQYFHGKVAVFALGTGVATQTHVTNMHAWAQVEFPGSLP